MSEGNIVRISGYTGEVVDLDGGTINILCENGGWMSVRYVDEVLPQGEAAACKMAHMENTRMAAKLRNLRAKK